MSYTPDRVFVERLKELDQKLGCFFNRTQENVVVTYERATGEPVPIYVVEAEGGGFRIPDMRDIQALQKGDLSRESAKERFRKTAKYMEDYRAKIEKQRNDLIKEATVDNKIRLARAFANSVNPSGKAYRHTRQIMPKSKGKVFR